MEIVPHYASHGKRKIRHFLEKTINSIFFYLPLKKTMSAKALLPAKAGALAAFFFRSGTGRRFSGRGVLFNPKLRRQICRTSSPSAKQSILPQAMRIMLLQGITRSATSCQNPIINLSRVTA